jgi:hypothetical protein
MPRGELDRDHPAEAVPDDHRPLEPELCTEAGEVVRAFRDVAAATEIDADDAVRPDEVLDLRLEELTRAAPAVHEDDGGIAGTCVVMIQPLRHRGILPPDAEGV